MRIKEEYYELVLENRRLAADPSVTICTCPNTLCDLHGKCRKCVALHRYHNDHLPYCLQPLLREKIKPLADADEIKVSPKEATPIEYRYYVKQKDKEEKQHL